MGHTFKHDGRSYTLTLDHGIYRLRSRAAGRSVNFSTGCAAAKPAEKAAKAHLEKGGVKTAVPAAKLTLEDVVTAYNAIPKRASEDSAVTNIGRLRGIVRAVTGKELSQFKLRDLTPKLWTDYMEHRLGGKLDLATRRPENAAINSGIVCARSLFIPRLHPFYKERGIIIPADIMQVPWLPRMRQPLPEAKDADLVKAWRKLKKVNKPLWFAIGAARFAGLRRAEISGLSRHWISQHGNAVKIHIQDRPAEGFRHKSGNVYTALVTDPEFAKELLACKEGLIVRPIPKDAGRPQSRRWWFKAVPPEWSKPFTGDAKKPLHRLRSLYLTELAKLTENAVLARMEGVKAAQVNAGHASSKTTKDHYLPADALP